jgi:hypothetical protein
MVAFLHVKKKAPISKPPHPSPISIKIHDPHRFGLYPKIMRITVTKPPIRVSGNPQVQDRM